MKTSTLNSLGVVTAVFCLFVGSSARLARAQAIGQPFASVPPFQLNFDEAGNSLLNGGANPNPVIPVTGGGIDFYLPGLVTPGQVLINAPMDINSANPNGDSDLLTFKNVAGLNGALTGVMRYESLMDPFDPVLAADVQRLNYAAPIPTLTETGIEGNNGFSYIVPGATYIGISDGLLTLNTPEPSSLVLASLGAASLAVLTQRRLRARRWRLPLVAAE